MIVHLALGPAGLSLLLDSPSNGSFPSMGALWSLLRVGRGYCA